MCEKTSRSQLDYIKYIGMKFILINKNETKLIRFDLTVILDKNFIFADFKNIFLT